MSQISPPIRILLVLTVAVLGVYMLFLRPKPVEVPPATPADTSVSEPGKVRDAAEDAVDAANGQLAQQESVDGVDAGEAAAGTGATRQGGSAKAGASDSTAAADLKGLPKPVRKAIRDDKVLVLLFWNGKSADDRAVEAALGKVDRWDGRVFVKAAPIKQISKYGRIARGVSVEQSPTVVVADRELRAETLVGYVDRATIDQAVVDAFRNTTGLFTSAYLREVDAVCAKHSSAMNGIQHWTSDPGRFVSMVKGRNRVLASFAGSFGAIKAPARWRSFRTATSADLAALSGAYGSLLVHLGPNPTAARVVSGISQFNTRFKPVAKRYRARVKAERLALCA